MRLSAVLDIIWTVAAMIFVFYATWLWFTQEGSRAQRGWAWVRDIVRVITGV